MEESIFKAGEFEAKLWKCNTVVVGSGAAGYNAADRLWQYGQHDILIVTENRMAGTSRNTGSDKQTYYKLTVSGDTPDSIREMTENLFSGQCVDGDIALCEAALSLQSFMKLVELGVPFPKNRYGEYIGYKTDHDPRRRATSVGPYTSKQMTEKLEESVINKGIRILNYTQVIKILSDGEKVYGLICLNINAKEKKDRFVIIQCCNVIYATGGPAGIYANSVYPESQFGGTGIALEAGVIGKNLTEWQYGMASVRPRWNVSGTYMQVLPRMYSINKDGSNEREFLMDFFKSPEEMLSKLFLKGYQWPFDVRKVENGSSIIDILVYIEICKGRRVFLDYRNNPAGGNFLYSKLDAEARDYLENAEACFGTPIERLKHMNMPAVEFYLDKGVNLEQEPLEISLCAQHNNGGLSIDCWWQTNIKGFFAVGEVAASHGVYRPGGTALNAGQVGSTRAAQYISKRCADITMDESIFKSLAEKELVEMGNISEMLWAKETNLPKLREMAAKMMSKCGAAIRNSEEIRKYIKELENKIYNFPYDIKISSAHELRWVFRYRDMLKCQYVYLSAMLDYINEGGKSRGSALYTDISGKKPYDKLGDEFTFIVDDGKRGNLIQEVRLVDGKCKFKWREIRPIPNEDDFFENVWREYRKNENIF